MAELSFPSSAVYKGLAVAEHTHSGGEGRPNSGEIELKLTAPASELQNPESALLAQPSARPETKSDLISAYYDTCILALYRRGMTLQVRRQRRQLVETIKAEVPARLDLLERREWQAPMKSQPALDALKIDRRLSNAIEKKDLRPIDSG